MKKWQLINLIIFFALILTTVSLIYILGTMNYTTPFAKPWHLLSSIHEDSLSQEYKNLYKIEGAKPLFTKYFDSSKVNIFVLIDAWGVPTQEKIMQEDFRTFESLQSKCTFALHRRLANNTRHAEHVEFRNHYKNTIFLFGGDSLQFNRTEYITDLGFKEHLFCSKCSNDSIITIIDSILIESNPPQFIAWTALANPVGNHDEIRSLFKKITNLAKKHTNIQFILQGTHRPMLCDYKKKSSYKSHWVPVVIIN